MQHVDLLLKYFQDFLEDVITDEYDWSNIKPPCVETANILHSATGPRTHLVIEEGFCFITILH